MSHAVTDIINTHNLSFKTDTYTLSQHSTELMSSLSNRHDRRLVLTRLKNLGFNQEQIAVLMKPGRHKNENEANHNRFTPSWLRSELGNSGLSAEIINATKIQISLL
ncbi:12998_t:CDS:2 [Ambispora leptoticha]|uniref:12998_t:CDS:1 n=1 Tax=Ambispora leptoticha TaxID=144679 RepID=A0A9N9C4A8_9GLOM|nr:12998_t:CDS:2 [Ambispora leptoticha]